MLLKNGVIRSSSVKTNKTNIACIAATTNNSESIYYLFQCGQTYNSSLLITSIPSTNFQVELYFHVKKSDKNTSNISLTQYIERNSCFRLSVERQFEDRLWKTLYKDKQSAATKRNISKLQSLSLKDKANTDEVNSGDSKCTDENIKKKMKKWKKSCGLQNYQ